MNLPFPFPIHAPWVIPFLAAWGVIVATLIFLLLRGRKKKSDAERERERRLAVNSIGRMTDGTLLEVVNSREAQKDSLLLLYRYSVSGVGYSAAQDISGLRHVVRAETYWPGVAVTVKYDSQNPSNSIVLCELWSGLHSSAELPPKRRNSQISVQQID